MSDIACKHGRDVTACAECFALRAVNIGVPDIRDPYEKPEVNLVDVGNLIDGLEQDEGQLYRELNGLGDKLDAFVDALSELEETLNTFSQRIDAAKLKLAKLEFIAEAGTSAKPAADGFFARGEDGQYHPDPPPAELRPDVEPPREALPFHAGSDASKA